MLEFIVKMHVVALLFTRVYFQDACSCTFAILQYIIKICV